jgi:hypothetical protein
MSVVVVTGSSGLIGSEAVDFFCEKRFDMVGLESRRICDTGKFEKHYPTWRRQVSPGATVCEIADAVSQRRRRAG